MRNWLSSVIPAKILAHLPALLFLFLTVGLFFTYIFSQMLTIKPEGVFIGHPNAWGDWVVHISITNIFANKPLNEWFLYHPFFAGGKLTYGFLVHLVTALFMKLGASLPTAFFTVSCILLYTFLTGIYLLYYLLSNSKKAALLGIALFFTSGGMGIFRFIKTLTAANILHPTQDYSTFNQYQWLAGNIPAAMLIPQRAFFIGITLGIWVLVLLLIQTSKKKQQKLFMAAGVLAGILPIAHMHSFISIVVLTGIFCAYHYKKWRQLAYFVIPATLLSCTLYLIFIANGIQVDNFMKVSFGWTAPKTLFSWIFMWLQLWGVALPLIAVWIVRFISRYGLRFNQKAYPLFLGFGVLFIIANSIIFQPTAWDNTKIFAWVYLGLAIGLAQILIHLSKTRFLQQTVVSKIIAAVLIVSLSSTGTVELLRIANLQNNTHLLSTTQEVAFAQHIAQHTPTDAVFLTSTTHNHPIPLWAQRPIFLGYLGWIRNFGFEDSLRAQQVPLVYQGDATADTILAENKISYIYVGPKENNSLTINSTYLSKFPVAFQDSTTIVYDSRHLWQ